MSLNLAPTFPALPRAVSPPEEWRAAPFGGRRVWSLECRPTPEAGLSVGVPESQPRGVVTLRKDGHWVVGEGKQAKLAPVELPHLLLLCSLLPWPRPSPGVPRQVFLVNDLGSLDRRSQ